MDENIEAKLKSYVLDILSRKGWSLLIEFRGELPEKPDVRISNLNMQSVLSFEQAAKNDSTFKKSTEEIMAKLYPDIELDRYIQFEVFAVHTETLRFMNRAESMVYASTQWERKEFLYGYLEKLEDRRVITDQWHNDREFVKDIMESLLELHGPDSNCPDESKFSRRELPGLEGKVIKILSEIVKRLID